MVKQEQSPDGDVARQVVHDQVEELARQGARQMLTAALHEEVEACLGRGRYERLADDGEAGRAFHGYRNGSSSRRLTLGSGTIPLAVPRVRDIPLSRSPGVAERHVMGLNHPISRLRSRNTLAACLGRSAVSGSWVSRLRQWRITVSHV